ncbi:hypothetical protein [Streptomyces sp. HB2AG]|uniref:hypothetical protein n=1 Tax=Streptomyces sp. HB2AG TaxID=2983400 RepID=UPI0022AA2A40|nr:hypothetical protein [Streptomyces sp. HB2AG]MCZ2524363.1 hypothetical protein [Streptomyces sp. HB2AG]
MRAKSNDDASRAKTVARSVSRASKSIIWGTSKPGKTSSALLAYTGRRNQKNVVKGAQPANRSITKGEVGATLKVKNRLQPQARKTRPTLMEQIKAPMTAAEARALTKALHAADRPTRKLPPRP